MYIALIHIDTYIQAESIKELCREAIRNGHVETEKEFIDCYGVDSIYKLNEPMEVTIKISATEFYTNGLQVE